MINDRRVHPRSRGSFEGRWREANGDRFGRLYDLSEGGCFIESTVLPARGQRVSLKLQLPGQGWISVNVEVVRSQAKRGFAVRFVNLTPESRAALGRTLDYLRGEPPPQEAS